jgi:hypothetical protein
MAETPAVDIDGPEKAGQPEKPETMKLTPQELMRLRDIIGERQELAEFLCQLELQKSEIMRKVGNNFETQKTFMDKVGRRLGLRDGQFNVNAETGEVTPGQRMG